ncbi:MAG: fructose-bisphosphatase class II family protein, partial [Thermoleophilia bacterium]|nr:fructose-bisphosphatase class II family protein [Thermoleophilia bacterium]
PPQVDIAVDPLEGTTLCARGMPSALTVVALSERGSMFDPGPCVYMEKLVGGPEIADSLSLDEPVGEVVKRVAECRGVSPTEVTTVILDRERHTEGVRQIREAGSRIRFISDGDVSAALLAVTPGTGVDLLWGIGGTPEGVLSAAAIKCLGGEILGRLWPRDDAERKAAEDAGYEIDQVLKVDDLVGGNDAFFAASGVTDGDLLQGVRYLGNGKATTESLVMRSRSGTVRKVQATHDQAKLREVTGGLYG